MTPRSKREAPAPETMLPLKSMETLMMTMLAGGERHGYGIRQDILEHSGGQIELEAGTLYRNIRRLESAGLIEPSSQRHAADDDERRIYYRLTPFGRRVLTAEMVRLRELVRLAETHRIIGPARA
jgi:DNA-binding PadR family transcriptional regulator